MPEIKIIYSRRRSIGLSVNPDNVLLVRAPFGTSRRRIDEVIQANQAWIDRARKKQSQMTRIPEIDSGTEALLRERTRIKAEDFISRWPDRKPGRLFIRNQGTRWGSCSSLGNLSLNFRLGLLPEELFEYVLVHELCHLKEMNHSPAFWSEVERYLPDYKIRRKKLNAIRFT